MKFLFLILLFSTNNDSMAQTNFTDSVNKLYFGVNMNNTSVDKIIRELQFSEKLRYSGENHTSSLSDNLKINTRQIINRRTFCFEMLRSPISNMKITSGCIKISMTNINGESRLLDVGWTIELENEQSAQEYLSALTQLFICNATEYSIDEDEKFKYIKYAQFSNSNLAKDAIRDIGFSLNKNLRTQKFEIRLFHYNDFMK